MLRRWVTLDGLRPRIAAIILLHAVALIAIAYVGLSGALGDQRPMYRLPNARDVALMARAFDETPTPAQQTLVSAFAMEGQRLAILQEFPADPMLAPARMDRALTGRALVRSLLQGENYDSSRTLARVNAAYHAALEGRPFSIQTEGGTRLKDFGSGRILSRAPIRVLVALRDGRVLAVERAALPVVARLITFTLPFVGTVLVIDLVGIFILARQTTLPVSRLLRAVQNDMSGDQAPDWPTDGPREIRELALAFAAMRARLHDLVEERTRMLAAVAHDYRTYLTRLQLRSDHISDDRQRSLALADLAEMSCLLDDTLTFAREMSAANDGFGETTDLTMEIECAAATRRQLGELIVIGHLPASMTSSIPRIAFQRILGNLLDNASRYGGSAAISATSSAEQIEVVIDDDGPGVPEAQLSRLTEPFHRLEESRARHTGGAGLGLSIVQALIERHGGRLLLENRAGGGFRARLQLMPSKPSA